MFTSDESQPFQDEMTDECDTEYRTLLSTKNLNLTKCRLVDVIKGLKSIAFFTKYLIISSIMISSPLTQKKYTTN